LGFAAKERVRPRTLLKHLLRHFHDGLRSFECEAILPA
jgi:hypothetical protein